MVKIPLNYLRMEPSKWDRRLLSPTVRSLFRTPCSDVAELARALYQAPLLAFHAATWDTLFQPGSYFSSGYHLLKTDFRTHCCPGTALSVNQTVEMPLFTATVPRQENSQSVCRMLMSTNLTRLWRDNPNLHPVPSIKKKCSTHPQRYPFCSRCHCRCRWAGSRCRSLESGCCCYSKDCTGWGWGEKIKLKATAIWRGQLSYKGGKFSSS